MWLKLLRLPWPVMDLDMGEMFHNWRTQIPVLFIRHGRVIDLEW